MRENLVFSFQMTYVYKHSQIQALKTTTISVTQHTIARMRDVFFSLQCEVGVSGRLANGLMRGRGGREENELALFLTRPFTLLSRRLSSSELIRLLPRLLLFVRSLSTFIIFRCCCLFVFFVFFMLACLLHYPINQYL